jgi:hypothetical protein
MEGMHGIDRTPDPLSLSFASCGADLFNLQPVTEAYVPIIKAVISGIDIDFAFATIPKDRVRT